MSNPYSAEILSAVSARITRDRIMVAHDWIHERLVKYGADAIGASAMNLIGSPAERVGFTEPGAILDAIRRCHDQSAESAFVLQRPSRWLVRSLFWALVDPFLSEMWLRDGLVRYEPNDPRLLAEALFSPNSASLEILTATLNAQDPVADRMALLGGAMWSLAVLTVLTPTLLAHLDNPDCLSDQPMPRDLCVAILADLRTDLLGDGRMEQFRALARRRQGRARAAQRDEVSVGEDGEDIPDIDLEAGVKEIVRRCEHRSDEGEIEGKDE